MKNEIWKPISGYEGLYEVSNLGKVRSLGKSLYNINENTYSFHAYSHVMKPSTNKGYLQVNLSKNGVLKCIKVHRLVAMAYIPNPNNYPQINHKNEIRKLIGQVQQDGFALIPLSLYLKGSKVKVALGVCKGKKLYDKRYDLQTKDAKRNMDRAFKEHNNRY